MARRNRDRTEIVALARAVVDSVIANAVRQGLVHDRQTAENAVRGVDLAIPELVDSAWRIGVDRDHRRRPKRGRYRLAVEDKTTFLHFDRIARKANDALDIILVHAGRSDDHHIAALGNAGEQAPLHERQGDGPWLRMTQ